MNLLGEICLLVTLVSTGYGTFLALNCVGVSLPSRERFVSTSGFVGLASLSLAIIVLAVALVQRDFGFEYVSQYANRKLPWHYCLSALWVGQAGSLMVWTWLTVAAAMLLRVTGREHTQLRTKAFGLLLGNVCFLVCVMLFAADPMASSLIVPEEGAGLSPLLQHPSMLIHPPIVFAAYAAWAVPCALAVAALWCGHLDATWLRIARPWALAGWTLLGSGLLIGANWAYQELGWGGYWGWDPVENGSLLPWLTGTAFVHGSIAWRQRQVLKRPVLLLSVLTYALCNFASFLTRSGIFSSVHAFSESPIGWMFLVLMAGIAGSGLGLVVHRRSALTSGRLRTSILARESLVGMSILLLVLLAAVILVGTLIAPLSRMFTGRMIEVGPGFYNSVFAPVGLILLAMTAVVPLIQWGGPPTAEQRRLLAASLMVSAMAAAAAIAVGVREYICVSVTALAALTIAAFLAAWFHDARQRAAAVLWRAVFLPLQNGRRKYAAYSVHLGIACLAIGIAGSSAGARRREAIMSEGEVIRWAERQIRYVRLEQSQLPDRLVASALLEVQRDGADPISLRPAKHLHLLQNIWTSEVAIHSSWAGDFYTVLHAGIGDGRVSLSFVNNPMIRWIWLGGIWSAASAVVAVLPTRTSRRLRVRMPNELPRPQPMSRAA